MSDEDLLCACGHARLLHMSLSPGCRLEKCTCVGFAAQAPQPQLCTLCTRPARGKTSFCLACEQAYLAGAREMRERALEAIEKQRFAYSVLSDLRHRDMVEALDMAISHIRALPDAAEGE